MKNTIRQLTDREHVRLRSAVYIGSVTPTKSFEYILDNDAITYKEVEYSAGLIKIINEILDNSVDVAIKSNFKSANLIQVKIDDKKVIVQDNGTGIPVVKNSDGIYLPRLAWGHARAGSNFDDDKNRTQIGLNGVGSFATNCFSKKFIGLTDDGKNAYKVTFKNGAESFTEQITPTKKQGTTVTFEPDLEMFGVSSINETHQNIIKQRLINLSMSFPEITFKFNGKKVNASTFKNYLKLFSNTAEIYETENVKFAILPNESDDFKQFSYVNGLKISDGGTHIDTVINNITSGLREKLSKRYKGIKPGDIRNKLMIVMFMKNFPNAKFNSQSKEKITNSTKEFNDFVGEIDYGKIVNKIYKKPEIIDNITELYRAKEEIARRRAMKKADNNNKKPKSEKFMPPIGQWKRLFVCEGDCLHEDTKIIMASGESKKIKDVYVNDYVISGDGSIQRIKSKNTSIRETVNIKTKSGIIKCSPKHRFYVYDSENCEFIFETALNISKDIKRYKMLRSKINKNTLYYNVEDNDVQKKILYLEAGEITYTDNDYFVCWTDGDFKRIHGSLIEKDMMILVE